MSLMRPVIRMCAVGALLGNTLAEDRVYDSDNTPLADALAAETKPYIVVYTDEDNRGEIEGRDIYLATRTLSLVLEIGVATGVQVEGKAATFTIPPTDEGMELIVDIVETQALAAIIGNPRGQWAELLRRMILSVVRMPSQRGGSAQGGTRWAARQVVLICDTLSDPPPGVRLATTHPVSDFIALAQQNTKMATAANLIEAVLQREENQPWRQAQAWLGLTTQGVKAMGIAPITDEEYAPKMSDITITTDRWSHEARSGSIDIEPPTFGAPELSTV